jgi:hypothetical protein
MTSAQYSHAEWRIELEAGALWSDHNDVQIPIGKRLTTVRVIASISRTLVVDPTLRRDCSGLAPLDPP